MKVEDVTTNCIDPLVGNRCAERVLCVADPRNGRVEFCCSNYDFGTKNLNNYVLHKINENCTYSERLNNVEKD